MNVLFVPILFVLILLNLGMIAFAILTPIMINNGKSKTPFKIVWFIATGFVLLFALLTVRYTAIFISLIFGLFPLILCVVMLFVTYRMKPKKGNTQSELNKMRAQELK